MSQANGNFCAEGTSVALLGSSHVGAARASTLDSNVSARDDAQFWHASGRHVPAAVNAVQAVDQPALGSSLAQHSHGGADVPIVCEDSCINASDGSDTDSEGNDSVEVDAAGGDAGIVNSAADDLGGARNAVVHNPEAEVQALQNAVKEMTVKLHHPTVIFDLKEAQLHVLTDLSHGVQRAHVLRHGIEQVLKQWASAGRRHMQYKWQQDVRTQCDVDLAAAGASKLKHARGGKAAPRNEKAKDKLCEKWVKMAGASGKDTCQSVGGAHCLSLMWRPDAHDGSAEIRITGTDKMIAAARNLELHSHLISMLRRMQMEANVQSMALSTQRLTFPCADHRLQAWLVLGLQEAIIKEGVRKLLYPYTSQGAFQPCTLHGALLMTALASTCGADSTVILHCARTSRRTSPQLTLRSTVQIRQNKQPQPSDGTKLSPGGHATSGTPKLPICSQRSYAFSFHVLQRSASLRLQRRTQQYSV